MERLARTAGDEKGSALILSILILFLVTVLAVIGSATTSFETKFSRHDKFDKVAFYQADGGAEIAKELIEQAIATRGWSFAPAPSTDGNDDLIVGGVRVCEKEFYNKDTLVDQIPSSNNRDAYIPITIGGQQRETNILFVSDTKLSTGGAIQMAAGYEGIGKGAAGGGTWIIYDIRSRHEGPGGSSAQVRSQWLHSM